MASLVAGGDFEADSAILLGNVSGKNVTLGQFYGTGVHIVIPPASIVEDGLRSVAIDAGGLLYAVLPTAPGRTYTIALRATRAGVTSQPLVLDARVSGQTGVNQPETAIKTFLIRVPLHHVHVSDDWMVSSSCLFLRNRTGRQNLLRLQAEQSYP